MCINRSSRFESFVQSSWRFVTTITGYKLVTKETVQKVSLIGKRRGMPIGLRGHLFVRLSPEDTL